MAVRAGRVRCFRPDVVRTTSGVGSNLQPGRTKGKGVTRHGIRVGTVMHGVGGQMRGVMEMEAERGKLRAGGGEVHAQRGGL